MVAAGAYAGVYRARMVTPPSGFTGKWVVVPRLNGDAPMGPCEHIGPATDYTAGDRVIVATVAGLKDDLVILGKIGG